MKGEGRNGVLVEEDLAVLGIPRFDDGMVDIAELGRALAVPLVVADYPVSGREA